jgi:SAM-dependent methyltransferase
MIDHSPEHADEVRQLFDTQAADWSARYAPGGCLTERLTCFTTVLGQQLPAGGRVLDLGCGSGEIARAAAAAGFQTTGCDISELMLRSAISQDSCDAVEWVRLDPQWRRLPFSAATFDAVVAASVLEYVDEPSAVLGECARVLRPGGLVACTVPDPRHPIRWLESLVGAGTRTPVAFVASRHWPRLEASRHWPRLEDYMTYLRVSRQRRTAGWWRAAAERAGLRPVPCSVDTARYSRLRLLTFRRPHQPGEPS